MIRLPARLSPRRSLVLAAAWLVSCGGDDTTEPTVAGTGIGTGIAASTSTGEGGGTGSPTPTTGGSEGPGGTSTGLTIGDPPEPGFCEFEPPLASSGLVFDGQGGVVMGVAPALGLETFTLEAWVRRDGRGRAAGTGVGGLKLVPIISKGRGESDGSELDCNYAFGFYGDVLGADFEDMASGKNHPIQGQTAIPLGSWHHVAASYDGTTWRLYVDGVLDAEQKVDAVPRHDSIQHFGLGAAYDSKGAAAGGLLGALDEVRVYDRALDAGEIQATMELTSPDPLGLVAHYRLDEGDADARDLVGEAPGTITGPVFAAPGAALDRGRAPVIGNAHTVDGGATQTLLVDAVDPDGDAVQVEFFARQLTAADDFTIVVLPDTQYYTRNAAPPTRPNPDDPEFFNAQTRWAWQHRHDRRVVGLFGLGDVINNADQTAQWDRASKALAILEDLNDPSFPDGLPYGVAFGNHDQFPKDVPEETTMANKYFGVDRFNKRGYYGGNFDGDNDANFVYFQAGGLPIVVLSFQFDDMPDADVLAWARGVFLAHPRALGIVASHYIVTGGGNFSTQGAAIYAALKDVPNVQLMASGHVSKDARRTDEFEGNVIHSMLSDFQRSAPDPDDPEKPVVVEQSQTNGGQGYMRIWSFSPATQKLNVTTYSPKKDASYTDGRNEFTLAVDLVGAGGAWMSLGVVAAKQGTAEVTLPGTMPGQRFEWYAVARDCVHETELGLQSVALVKP